MYPHRQFHPGQLARLTVAASLLAAAAQVFAAPPTASSPATTTAREAYKGCLLEALGSVPAVSQPMAVWSATDGCATQEAALTAAVLAENPDRPLFAKSYAMSLKEDLVSRLAPDAIVGSRSTMTVARMTRP